LGTEEQNFLLINFFPHLKRSVLDGYTRKSRLGIQPSINNDLIR